MSYSSQTISILGKCSRHFLLLAKLVPFLKQNISNNTIANATKPIRLNSVNIVSGDHRICGLQQHKSAHNYKTSIFTHYMHTVIVSARHEAYATQQQSTAALTFCRLQPLTLNRVLNRGNATKPDCETIKCSAFFFKILLKF